MSVLYETSYLRWIVRYKNIPFCAFSTHFKEVLCTRSHFGLMIEALLNGNTITKCGDNCVNQSFNPLVSGQ